MSATIRELADNLIRDVGEIHGDIKAIRNDLEKFEATQTKQWERHDQEITIRRTSDAELERQINEAKGGFKTLKWVVVITVPLLYGSVAAALGYLVSEIIVLHDHKIMVDKDLQVLSSQRLEATIPPGWWDIVNDTSEMKQRMTKLEGAVNTLSRRPAPSVHTTVVVPKDAVTPAGPPHTYNLPGH